MNAKRHEFSFGRVNAIHTPDVRDVDHAEINQGPTGVSPYRGWFCVFCAFLWLAIPAQPAHGVALRVGVVRGFPGNTVEVPVSLNYSSNEVRNVVALQADVLFDASGMNDGTPNSGPLLSRHVLAFVTPSPGV